jgi:hypothetical protein
MDVIRRWLGIVLAYCPMDGAIMKGKSFAPIAAKISKSSMIGCLKRKRKRGKERYQTTSEIIMTPKAKLERYVDRRTV